MANGKGDVELVIRAKNDATKAVQSVVEDLKKLVGVQTDAGKSAQQTDTLLGKLKATFVQLDSEIKGLSALAKIARSFDQAQVAVQRLEKQFGSTTAETQRLAAENEKASASVTKLTGEVQQSATALEKQRVATAAARAESSAQAKALKEAETALSRMADQVDRLKTPNAQLVATWRAQRDVVAQLRAGVAQSNTGYTAQKTALDQATIAFGQQQTALKTASQGQRQLQGSFDASSVSLQRQEMALAKAKGELAEISTIAHTTSAALGGVAATQDAVAAASSRAAADLAKVGTALANQKGGGSAPTVASGAAPMAAIGPAAAATQAYRDQVQAVVRAEQAWRAAQAQANALAREVRGVEQPTTALTSAFLLSQQASKDAKQAYLDQGTALQTLQGKAKGSFAVMEQSAEHFRQTSAATAALRGLGAIDQAVLAQSSQSAGATAASSSIGSLLGMLTRFPAAARDAAAGIAGVGAAGTTAAGAMDGFTGSSRQSMSVLQRLRGEVLSLVASYVGLFQAVNQIGALVDTFRTMDAVQSRLGVVFNQNTDKVAAEVEFLRQNAIRLAIPFSILAGEYTKFAVSTKEAGFSQEATRKIFLSVAEAGKVNRLSIEELGGVFLALTQMVQKGSVQSEELRRQLGNRLPGAFNLFADSVGVSTGKLGDLLKKGSVLADQDTLVAFADQLTKKFGPQLGASLESVSTQLDRFKTRAELARLEVDKGGFAAALGDVAKKLNDALADDKVNDFFRSLGRTLGNIVSLLPSVVDNFGVLGTALQLFLSLKIGQAILGMFVQFGGLNRVMNEGRAVWAGAQVGMLAVQSAITSAYIALTNFRTTMTAATAGFAGFSVGATVSRAAVIAFEATLTGLRFAMTAVAGVARVMWVAIGGLPGLVITGITFLITELLGKWLTGVDDASVALQAHDKIIEAVKRGYDEAGGKVDQWAEKIKGVTRFEVLNQLTASVTEMGAALDKLQSPRAGFGTDLRRGLPDIEAAIKALKEGTISGEEFRKKISAIGEAEPRFSKDFINALLETSRRFDDAKKRADQFQAVLRVLDGTASDADKALLGLKSTLDDTFDTKALDRFNDALDKMRKLVPEVKKELKHQEDIDAAKKLFEKAVKAADSDPALLKEAQDTFNSTIAKINARAAKEAADALPINNNDIVKRIKFIEGNQNALNRQPTSMTAQGIGQFQGDTWLKLFNQVFPALVDLTKEQKLALRFNEEAADKLLHALTKENQASLLKSGIDVTPGNTVLAHFLGAGDAIKVILADAETPVEKVLSKAVIDANKELLLGKTTGQVVQGAVQRAGGGSTITSTGATEGEKFNATLDERLKKLKAEGVALAANEHIDELSAQAKFDAKRDMEIAKVIAEEETKALAANTTLTQARRDEIAKSVAETYNLVHAQALLNAKLKEQRDADKEKTDFIHNVVGLDSQRTTAQKDLRLAQNEGTPEQVADLKTQLKDITKQIEDALPKAREFAAALGNEKLVASLDKVELHMKTIKTEVVTAKQINDAFISDAIKGFDTIGASIGAAVEGTKSWGDVLGDVGKAFLQFAADFLKQIANMILQQALLNALQSLGFGSGKSLGGVIAGGINALVAHTGAVVGSSGGWNQTVPVAAFSNAVRYHEGGIAGLKPGEVPAVLQKGEEVLTSDNPRHIMNQVGGGSQKAGDIKIVNAIDSGDFVSQGLNTRVGEKSMLNFIRSNKGAVKSALGVA